MINAKETSNTTEQQTNTKANKVKKEHVIRVRVTDDEHERFRTKARSLGYRSVSAYIRTLIDEDSKNR